MRLASLVSRTSLAALALSAIVAPIAAVGAQGWVVPRPCIQPAPPPRVDPMMPRPCPVQAIERVASEVRVSLDDRVLHWEVEERFVNRGAGLGEADYIFPLPTDAAFQDLKLSIDGQLVAGETMSADEARRIYEEIVRRQRDPALVEWMGHGLLRARIFPLPPGEEKRVVVRFTSVVPREGDAWRVDYSRGTGDGGRGTGLGQLRSPVLPPPSPQSFTLTYPLTASIGRPYSPTHELEVRERDGRRQVEAHGGGDVTVLLPVRRGESAAISALAYAPGGEDGYALVTVAPPAESERLTTPRDVTFVLDVSGSMSGAKIAQARAAGKQLLATLRPRDRFRLIDFSTDVRTFRDAFAAATPENVRAAERYLDALDATGSTNIEGALRAAFDDDAHDARAPDDDAREGDARAERPRDAGRLRLVLFVTDGEPTVGERRPEALARLAADRRGDARLFTFGLGADVNAALIERLALDGGGTAQFVRPEESVERMVGVVAARLVDPVLTDVRVRVDDDAVRLEPLRTGRGSDLFAGQDLVVLARYRGHGRVPLVVEGRHAGVPVRWRTTVELPDRSRENAFVARLWAVQRIGFLSAERRRVGANPELDAELRTLGERFGIPTELTAYLVREPVVAMRDRMNGMPASDPVPPRGMAAPAPEARRERAFDAAKAASEQRQAVSIAAAEAATGAGAGMGGAAGGTTARRTVGERSFELRDGAWIDTRFHDGMRTVRVQAFSAAYFDLLARLPELAQPMALGQRVTVAGRRVAVEVADDGAERLDRATLDRLVADWR